MESRNNLTKNINSLFTEPELNQKLQSYLVNLVNKDRLKYDYYVGILSRLAADNFHSNLAKNNNPHSCLLNFTMFLSALNKDYAQHSYGLFDDDFIEILKWYYTHYRESLFYWTQERLESVRAMYSPATYLLGVAVFSAPSLLEFFFWLGIDLNQVDKLEGNTELICLIANAWNTKAKWFMETTQKIQPNMLDLDAISSLYGTAAIHLIVGKGYRQRNYFGEKLDVSNLELLKILLDSGADINLKTKLKQRSPEYRREDFTGCTALHLACARNDIEYVEYLLNRGADPTIKNNAGKTPYDMFHLPHEEAQALVKYHVTVGIFELCYSKYQRNENLEKRMCDPFTRFCNKLEDEIEAYQNKVKQRIGQRQSEDRCTSIDTIKKCIKILKDNPELKPKEKQQQLIGFLKSEIQTTQKDHTNACCVASFFKQFTKSDLIRAYEAALNHDSVSRKLVQNTQGINSRDVLLRMNLKTH